MGRVKRPPAIPSDLYDRFYRISKADWAEIFRDAWLEAAGIEEPSDADEEAWMADAERRLSILHHYR